jgi:hypothetical protein
MGAALLEGVVKGGTMTNETVHDDDSLIDVADSYTDGDGLQWSITSVNVNERTMTVECRNPPSRSIPMSDLANMERNVPGKSDGVDPSAVGRVYTDQDDLRWIVGAVNLRDRTVTIKLMNPPRRTISVEQLRKMRSLHRESEASMRSLSQSTRPKS